MSAYENNPKNINQLYGDKFKLVFMAKPHVEFFAKTINLPGISMQEHEIHNPVNKLYYGATKLTYDPLTVTFRVDENLMNFKEIHSWMIGITAPQSTDQFKDFIEENNKLEYKAGYSPVYSDCTLVSLTNAANINVKIFFKDMFPVSLTGLDMDLETASGTLSATCTFRYNYYIIE